MTLRAAKGQPLLRPGVWLMLAWAMIFVGIAFLLVTYADQSMCAGSMAIGFCLQVIGFCLAVFANQRGKGLVRNLAAVTMGLVWAWWILIGVMLWS
jgi:hypothetical protein